MYITGTRAGYLSILELLDQLFLKFACWPSFMPIKMHDGALGRGRCQSLRHQKQKQNNNNNNNNNNNKYFNVSLRALSNIIALGEGRSENKEQRSEKRG